MKDQVLHFLQKTNKTIISFFDANIMLIVSIICFIVFCGVFYYMLVIKVGMDPGFYYFGIGVILLGVLRSVTNP